MVTHTMRTFDEEEEYLSKHYDNEFSRYVHDSFKRDINLTKNNKQKNKLQQFTYNVVMLGFGAIFILFAGNTNNLMGFIAIFLLGVFFLVAALANIFFDVKNIGKKFKDL